MPTPYRVADYIADFIATLGVGHVFLLPGGGAMHLNDAVGKHPHLEVVACHHEQAAAIAAEAYGRIQQNIGVAMVTTGPGATNAVTAVAGAWIESVPLLLLSGQVKRADLLRGSPLRQKGVQEVDIVSIVRPITKYAVTVERPEDIRRELEHATFLARTGRAGPVWIDVPLDVQGAPIDPATLEGWQPDAPTAPAIDPAQLTPIRALLEKAASGPAFKAKFKQRFKAEPDVYASAYYDAVLMYAASMQKLNTIDPAKVGADLSAGSYKGVSGTYAFDAKGDMKSSPVTIFNFKAGQPAAIASY